MNVDRLATALKRLAILILLFIASPVLLTMAFKAIKRYQEGFEYWLSHLFLVSAGLLIIFTIYFAFKTFGTISKAIFQK